MKKSSEILLEKYQVRKTKKQKQDFGVWLADYLSEYDYTVVEDKYSKNGSNYIVGDVESADVILTAHYDTQPTFFFPVTMGFSNWISFFISQILMMIPIFIFAALYSFIIFKFSLGLEFFLILAVLLLAYSIQMMCGLANKHTANDNTSGVATLISILEDISPEDREKICVVFFDEEELGLIGSKKFYKKYKESVIHKPLFNFDCVSDGEILTFVMKKKFKDSSVCGLLKKASDEAIKNSEKKIRFADALWNVYMSDQLHFPNGVGVVAAKKAHIFGYYINRIHSKWDTKFDSKNIELLKNTMLKLIKKI